MLAVFTVNSTEDASGLAGSATMVPWKSVNRPRTLETKWRIWNDTSE